MFFLKILIRRLVAKREPAGYNVFIELESKTDLTSQGPWPVNGEMFTADRAEAFEVWRKASKVAQALLTGKQRYVDYQGRIWQGYISSWPCRWARLDLDQSLSGLRLLYNAWCKKEELGPCGIVIRFDDERYPNERVAFDGHRAVMFNQGNQQDIDKDTEDSLYQLVTEYGSTT